jgi:plastocyanin
MHHKYRIVVAALAVASLAAGCGRGEESGAPATPAASNAPRVDASKAGAIAGRIVVQGAVPEGARVPMNSDPVCARAHPDGSPMDAIVAQDGGLNNVFVYVKDGLGNYRFDAPAEAVKLDQQGCRYQPRVFGVQVGQPIEIVNSDETMHNVHALPEVNQEFNFGQVIKGQRNTRTFTAREVMVRFKCDVHGWMTAYAGVLDHPYFAVSKDGGRFELKNLPAGTYTVEAWHEKLGTQAQSVTIGEKESKDVTFTFNAAATTIP